VTAPAFAKGSVVALDRAGVEGLIPHRGPMLLLERVPWLEPGARAVALAARDLALRAPGVVRSREGEVPPELLIEAAAQAAAALLVAEGVAEGRYPHGEPQPGVLAAVPEWRFLDEARPGEEVVLRVEVVRRLGRLVLLSCEATAGARPAARGTVSIALGKPGS
jgi:3-hydroxyacyl-[acyl-carrier-protein] dehydratase